MRAAALAILAVVLVAGCGGGSSRLSKSQFETHLKRDALLASRATTVASTANGETSAVYANRIAHAQSEMHKAANDLATLTPPKDAESDTKTLIAALRFLDVQLGKLSQAAAKGNSAAARAVSDAVSKSKELRAVDAAVKDLQGKGYDVGLFGH
jgi:hypothetical protein